MQAEVLTIILSIGIPMLTGFGAMIFLIVGIKDDVKEIDKKLAHLDGYLEGAGVKKASGS